MDRKNTEKKDKKSYRLFDNAEAAFLVLWCQQAACLRRLILQESDPETKIKLIQELTPVPHIRTSISRF